MISIPFFPRFFLLLFLFVLQIHPLQAQERSKRIINSGWDFSLSPEHPTDSTTWEKVNLPHTWNAFDMLDDSEGYYRGTGWYKKTITVAKKDSSGVVWIFFDGANQDARVYINGQMAGSHLGGYTRFGFNITDFLEEGENMILVELSNAYNPDVPPVGGDLGHFGGIYRDVSLVETGLVYFHPGPYYTSGVKLQPRLLLRGGAAVNLELNLYSPHKKRVLVKTQIFDSNRQKLVESEEEFLLGGGIISNLKTAVMLPEDPLLWSPSRPELYSAKVSAYEPETGELLDEAEEYFGFRTIKISDSGDVLLNDNPLFIRGIGKHQDYKQMGYAVPNDILMQDIRLAKETGANLIRSHYPLSGETYDMCDRLGLLVWGKIPIMDRINHSDEFAKNSAQMMQEFMEQNINRPSFVLWGYACELFGDMDWYWEQPKDPQQIQKNILKTLDFSVRFERMVREIDPTRLTGNDFHTDPTPEYYLESGLTDINMINGWNIYQGWYHNNLDSIASALRHFYSWNPDLPFVIAEYGAGSDPRIHSYEPTIFDFSMEYQNLFHERYLEAVKKLDFVQGMSLWTLVDFQVDSRKDAVPHINSKGILTTDRKKKDAFYLYKANWSSDPFIHIVSGDWDYRIESRTEYDIKRPLKVYTSLERAELTMNGMSLGGKKSDDLGIIIWEVDFKNGINRVEVSGYEGDSLLIKEAEIRIATMGNQTDYIDLPGGELCINVGQSGTYFKDELRHDHWIPDREYPEDGFGHLDGDYYNRWENMKAWDGIRQGIDRNILGTELDPVFQTFLLGLTNYRIDIEPGYYRISLYFAEPFTEDERKDTGMKTGADKEGRRVFDISLNGKTVLKELDLSTDFGVQRAVIQSFDIYHKGGALEIGLEGSRGRPVLNGIKLENTGF